MRASHPIGEETHTHTTELHVSRAPRASSKEGGCWGRAWWRSSASWAAVARGEWPSWAYAMSWYTSTPAGHTATRLCLAALPLRPRRATPRCHDRAGGWWDATRLLPFPGAGHAVVDEHACGDHRKSACRVARAATPAGGGKQRGFGPSWALAMPWYTGMPAGHTATRLCLSRCPCGHAGPLRACHDCADGRAGFREQGDVAGVKMRHIG